MINHHQQQQQEYLIQNTQDSHHNKTEQSEHHINYKIPLHSNHDLYTQPSLNNADDITPKIQQNNNMDDSATPMNNQQLEQEKKVNIIQRIKQINETKQQQNQQQNSTQNFALLNKLMKENQELKFHQQQRQSMPKKDQQEQYYQQSPINSPKFKSQSQIPQENPPKNCFPAKLHHSQKQSQNFSEFFIDQASIYKDKQNNSKDQIIQNLKNGLNQLEQQYIDNNYDISPVSSQQSKKLQNQIKEQSHQKQQIQQQQPKLYKNISEKYEQHSQNQVQQGLNSNFFHSFHEQQQEHQQQIKQKLSLNLNPESSSKIQPNLYLKNDYLSPKEKKSIKKTNNIIQQHHKSDIEKDYQLDSLIKHSQSVRNANKFNKSSKIDTSNFSMTSQNPFLSQTTKSINQFSQSILNMVNNSKNIPETDLQEQIEDDPDQSNPKTIYFKFENKTQKPKNPININNISSHEQQQQQYQGYSPAQKMSSPHLNNINFSNTVQGFHPQQPKRNNSAQQRQNHQMIQKKQHSVNPKQSNMASQNKLRIQSGSPSSNPINVMKLGTFSESLNSFSKFHKNSKNQPKSGKQSSQQQKSTPKQPQNQQIQQKQNPHKALFNNYEVNEKKQFNLQYIFSKKPHSNQNQNQNQHFNQNQNNQISTSKSQLIESFKKSTSNFKNLKNLPGDKDSEQNNDSARTTQSFQHLKHQLQQQQLSSQKKHQKPSNFFKKEDGQKFNSNITQTLEHTLQNKINSQNLVKQVKESQILHQQQLQQQKQLKQQQQFQQQQQSQTPKQKSSTFSNQPKQFFQTQVNSGLKQQNNNQNMSDLDLIKQKRKNTQPQENTEYYNQKQQNQLKQQYLQKHNLIPQNNNLFNGNVTNVIKRDSMISQASQENISINMNMNNQIQQQQLQQKQQQQTKNIFNMSELEQSESSTRRQSEVFQYLDNNINHNQNINKNDFNNANIEINHNNNQQAQVDKPADMSKIKVFAPSMTFKW